jgi:carboxymethylenebutenolidase
MHVAPSVMARVPKFSCPILALQAGDDLGIPVDVDDRFAALMKAEGKDGEVVIYEHAPHSFFDRKQDEFGEESADAWRRVLAFIGAHG